MLAGRQRAAPRRCIWCRGVSSIFGRSIAALPLTLYTGHFCFLLLPAPDRVYLVPGGGWPSGHLRTGHSVERRGEADLGPHGPPLGCVVREQVPLRRVRVCEVTYFYHRVLPLVLPVTYLKMAGASWAPWPRRAARTRVKAVGPVTFLTTPPYHPRDCDTLV